MGLFILLITVVSGMRPVDNMPLIDHEWLLRGPEGIFPPLPPLSEASNYTTEDLSIQFNSRSIQSSSPMLMKWTDTLRERTAAQSREQQIALTRDHLLKRMWAATGAQVHVTWPDYASQASREAVKEELRNHGYTFHDIGGGVMIEVGAPN